VPIKKLKRKGTIDMDLLWIYCHLARNELLTFDSFHFKTEQLWKEESKIFSQNVDSILASYPEDHRHDIVEHHVFELNRIEVHYPEMHRSSLIISLYVFLEVQLNGLCNILGTSIQSKLKLEDFAGKGIERAFLFMSKVASFDLSKFKLLPFLRGFNQLRNNLIHANGILPTNEGGKVNVFVKESSGLDGVPDGRIRINAEFISDLIKKLDEFFTELETQVMTFMARQASRNRRA
jgi:hypothetical protein